MKFAHPAGESPRQCQAAPGGLLTAEQREALARVMYEEVLEKLDRGAGHRSRGGGDQRSNPLPRTRARAGVMVFEEQDQHSHSHSADRAARRAMELGAGTVLLLPIDVPLVTTAEIESLAGAARPGVIIVPSADGTGTNALVRTPPDVIESRFGKDSFRAHLEQARAKGVAADVMRPPGIVFDVDTPEDVAELLARAPDSRTAELLRAQRTAMGIRIVGLEGLPEVRRGDDLAALIREGAVRAGHALDSADDRGGGAEGGVEGRGRGGRFTHHRALGAGPRVGGRVAQGPPSHRGDSRPVAAHREDGSRGADCRDASRLRRGERRRGPVECAGEDRVTLLPEDPDRSAGCLRAQLGCGGVMISDTFGRPWREGLVNVAIGVAGFEPLEDYRGQADYTGRALQATVIALADEIAAGAGLVMRKSDRVPVALVYGLNLPAAEGSAGKLLRDPARDLFR